MAKVKCENCGTKFTGNYCPVCSAPAPVAPVKKKKKWLIPLIVVLILVLAVSCLGSGDEEIKQPSSVQADVPSSGISASQTEPTDAASVESNTLDAVSNDAPEEISTTSANQVTLDDVTIYDNNGIVVIASGMDTNVFGPCVNITVANQSAQNVVIHSQNLSVNNYMLSTSSFYCEVAAGKNAVATLDLYSSELDSCGIATIGDIVFDLAVYDSDSFVDIDLVEGISLQTSAYGTFEQSVDDSGDVVYDSNGIRVICKGLKDDMIWDGTIVFFVENSSSREVSIYSENVSVNDYMVDASFWADLKPGTKAVDGMYLWEMDAAQVETIDDVKNLEFSLTIVDYDTWDTIDTTAPIVLSFE